MHIVPLCQPEVSHCCDGDSFISNSIPAACRPDRPPRGIPVLQPGSGVIRGWESITERAPVALVTHSTLAKVSVLQKVALICQKVGKCWSCFGVGPKNVLLLSR